MLCGRESLRGDTEMHKPPEGSVRLTTLKALARVHQAQWGSLTVVGRRPSDKRCVHPDTTAPALHPQAGNGGD